MARGSRGISRSYDSCKYTVDEARDLINSILLSKGYTLLRNGEVLLVANLKTLDTSLVPRVMPKELDSRGTYELVRTFFDLDRLQAEPMSEELKPLLSPYGKINALKTTNRLDVLDTAGNLRRIRDVVGAEQGESGKSHQLREYKLDYARADDVLATLKQLLGIQPDKSGPMSREEMQQQMQHQQQMMQQMQQQAQQNGNKTPPGPKQEEKIYLAINRRENSIMALATPDKLAVIEQAVKLLDVPNASATRWGDLDRVRPYRLVTADPTAIVNILKDMGNLDPSTRLEVDNVNRAIIVNGPMVDHYTVQKLIEKLDGSARHFEVIPLRKLDAEYVAGSIEFLMRGPSKDSSRPRYVFGDYRVPEQGKDGGFQVEADTKNNRLVLRVNDVELQEIYALMKKLGEDPFLNSQAENMRVIHAAPGKETDLLLERLKRVWPTISPHPLQLDIQQPEEPATDKPNGNKSNQDKNIKQKQNETKTEDADRGKQEPDLKQHRPAPTATVIVPLRRQKFAVSVDAAYAQPTADLKQPNLTLAETDSRGADSSSPLDSGTGNLHPPLRTLPEKNADEPANPSEAAPISIIRGPQGLIVTSKDPAIVDQLTRLIDELSPSNSHYQVFSLKHTYARDVSYLLEKIFEQSDSKDKNRFNPFFFDFDQQDKKEERGRLSKCASLKFTPDAVTNSILVQNADDDQITQIRQLVEFYDRAEPPDSQSIRKTQIVPIKYAKAQAVSDVLKDVYRDLLSPNDKALSTNNQRQGEQQRPFWTYFGSDDSSRTSDNLPKFKGLLSIGIDPSSNSLVVSAPQFLLTDVLSMIERLDNATKPMEPVVRVISVGGILDDPLIKDALKSVADPEVAKRSSSAAQSRGNNGSRNGGWNNNGRNGRSNNGNGGNGNGNTGQNNNR